MKKFIWAFLIFGVAAFLFGAPFEESAAKAFDKGLDFVQSNDYRRALRYFRQAAQYDPTFASAFLNIGACHERLNEFAEARPYYEKAIELEKDNAKFSYLYALALLRNNCSDEGLKKLEEAVFADPKNPDYIYELGLAHLAKKQKERAKACFIACLDIHTNYHEAYFRLGVLAVEEHNTNEALRLLEKVDLDCPLAHQSFLLRSRLLRSQKRLSEAESLARISLKLSRNFWEGYLNLAQILREEKKYREATEILERVELQELKGNWAALLGRIYEEWGDSLMQAGKEKAAKTIYQQGLRFLPEDENLLKKAGTRQEQKASEKGILKE